MIAEKEVTAKADIKDTATRRAYIAYKGPNKNGLCYFGRLDRAMEMGNIALMERNQTKADAIAKAAKIVESEMAAAYDAYIDMSRMSGEQYIDSVCDCEYCQAAQTEEILVLAGSVMIRSLYEFLHPDGNGNVPRGLSLWEDGSAESKAELGRLIGRILVAQRNYIRACDSAGINPAWNYIFNRSQ